MRRRAAGAFKSVVAEISDYKGGDAARLRLHTSAFQMPPM
jgi:hypothetical protein